MRNWRIDLQQVLKQTKSSFTSCKEYNWGSMKLKHTFSLLERIRKYYDIFFLFFSLKFLKYAYQ